MFYGPGSHCKGQRFAWCFLNQCFPSLSLRTMLVLIDILGGEKKQKTQNLCSNMLGEHSVYITTFCVHFLKILKTRNIFHVLKWCMPSGKMLAYHVQGPALHSQQWNKKKKKKDSEKPRSRFLSHISYTQNYSHLLNHRSIFSETIF